MKTLLDVHTHTIASGHAFSTLQEMALAAKEKGLEILGITKLLQLAKKYETPVIFGSDAHFSTMIADYSNIVPLAEKCYFPDELVLNYSPEKFLSYIKPMPK